MRKLRYKLITFDLDDTLWDIRPVLERAERRVNDWIGKHCPVVTQRYDRSAWNKLRLQLLEERAELRHQLGTLRQECMRRAMLDCGYDETNASRLAGEAFAVFIEARHEVQPFDEVEVCLQKLQQDYVLGVLTNGNADIFRIGLGKYFNFAFRAEDLLASKPDPHHFNAAMLAAGAGAEQTIHIGDHPESDIEGAQRLGITTVWFNPARNSWPGNQAPSAQFSRFSDLSTVISELEKD